MSSTSDPLHNEGPSQPSGFPSPPDEDERYPPRFYEYAPSGPNGDITVWDWRTLAEGSTHVQRLADDGIVYLFAYDSVLLTLAGPAAESFWAWLTAERRDGYGGRMRVHRRRHRNHSIL
jgi:hypothetical protein